MGNQTFRLPCSSVVHTCSKSQYTTFKYTKNRCSVQHFWREIATCTHFRCQDWCMQSAGHTLGRGFQAPDSDGGADSWCAMPSAHIVDTGVGWSQLLKPHPTHERPTASIRGAMMRRSVQLREQRWSMATTLSSMLLLIMGSPIHVHHRLAFDSKNKTEPPGRFITSPQVQCLSRSNHTLQWPHAYCGQYKHL